MSEFTKEILKLSGEVWAAKEATRNLTFGIGNAQRMGDKEYEAELRQRRAEVTRAKNEAQQAITALIQGLRSK